MENETMTKKKQQVVYVWATALGSHLLPVKNGSLMQVWYSLDALEEDLKTWKEQQ